MSMQCKNNAFHTTLEPMQSNLRTFLWLTALSVILVIICQGAATACPTCKDGLASGDPNSANLVRGYFWSIVFLMSMPFLVLGGLATYFYWLVCRTRAEQSLVAARPSQGVLPGEPLPTAF